MDKANQFVDEMLSRVEEPAVREALRAIIKELVRQRNEVIDAFYSLKEVEHDQMQALLQEKQATIDRLGEMLKFVVNGYQNT